MSDSENSLVDVLLEATNRLEKCMNDPMITKEDMGQDMEHRLSVILGKIVAHPTATSFCLFKS